MRIATTLAENGDVAAAAEVGYLLSTGKAGVRDPAKAAEWYRYAAEKGNAIAAYNLALLFQTGDGVHQDHKEAFRWYSLAADQGNQAAEEQIASMYNTGQGTERNATQAVKWWEVLAKAGNVNAQYNLAQSLDQGDGVPRNFEEALKWYRSAAEHGQVNAQNDLGVFLDNGLVSSQEDPCDALKWFLSAAQGGNSEGQRNLGVMYAAGRCTPKDDAKSFYWLKQAAERGHAEAQRRVGMYYSSGIGVPEDYVHAYMWLNVAAANTSKDADHARQLRDDLADKMTAGQIAEAQALSRSWRTSTAPVYSGTTPSQKGQGTLSSTGTGFFVNQAGYLITNFHVVNGCSELRWGSPSHVAQLVSSDSQNDLAVLKTDVSAAHYATLSAKDVVLGQQVYAVGFPLRGIVASTLNATAGTVSAMAGLNDDSRFVQVTAPIQPGNSGGPLLSTNGAVVGVVTSKLNPKWATLAVGDIPQNVNFAIRSAIVRVFLEANGVAYVTVASAGASNRRNVIAAAQEFTVPIECWK